ncbi:MAG: NAD(P)H-dependent oxidoreductase [Rhizobiaceae bacterium]
MRVLLVYCHPVPDSFNAAVRDTAIEALTQRGWEVRVSDLYAENFDPVMREDERRTYNDHAPADPALAPHIDNLRWAEALLFVYPTWWYGLPAMLKGWLDRVWALDVAFSLDRDRGMVQPLLRHVKRVGVVTTCGAPLWWSVLVGQPGRKTILRGMRANCAHFCRTLYVAHHRMDVSTPESRTAFLMKVRARLARW